METLEGLDYIIFRGTLEQWIATQPQPSKIKIDETYEPVDDNAGRYVDRKAYSEDGKLLAREHIGKTETVCFVDKNPRKGKNKG